MAGTDSLSRWHQKARERWPEADWSPAHPLEDGDGRFGLVTECVILSVKLYPKKEDALRELAFVNKRGCLAEPCDPSLHRVVDLEGEGA